jgi:DNA polymerase III subunit delta
MTYEEILQSVKAGKFAPVYVLHGEESFYIDQIEEAIDRHALPESEKGFNQTILYGKEVDAVTLLDSLRRYPMMSERQVVILREAQEMKSLSDLGPYMENPMATTVFVVCYKHKKLDLNTKFGKTLKAKCVVFEGKKLYDNQAPDWIANYCRSKKLQIDGPTAALLAEYLGTELSKITNEIDKLALNLAPGAAITAQHIQEFVGISKEYNVYELQKAFATRDLAKLARIQQNFESNIKKNPLIVTISSLHAYFSKVFMLHFLRNSPDAEVLKALELRSDWFLKEYKLAMNNYSVTQVKTILGYLKAYDLRSKGVDTDTTSTGEEELMKELFFKMLNA